MKTLVCATAVLLLTLPLSAEDCSEQATVGNFDIEFMGAVYDGFDTNFAYCVTGLDVPGFHALSNWMMAFDVACIDDENLVGCGPEPCFYQENDPNHGITGIKWDDTEVEKGETKCYDFTLDGDWTSLVHQTTVGVKAATEVSQGGICGPICVGCTSFVQVLAGEELLVSARLIHQRPPTVTTPITLSLVDKKNPGTVLAEWTEGPVKFEYGTRWEYLGPIPGISSLPPGKYILSLKTDGMSGFQEIRTKFRIEP